jgi:hypothetical protein
MNFSVVKHSASAFLSENAATIFTAGGVVGTVTTGTLAWRAGYKTALKEGELNFHKEEDEPSATKGEVLKETWQINIPPVIIGSLAVSSIVASNLVSARKAAALAAAYAIADGRLEEYKQKVQEKLTGPKNKAIKDEIAQDRVTNNPPSKEVIIIASGEVLCHDSLTGRYFHSTVEQIRKAEHYINAELAGSQYASLSQFYDELGLPVTSYSDQVGWSALNQDVQFELNLSTVMTPDQKPCISIDYSILPTPEYHRTY